LLQQFGMDSIRKKITGLAHLMREELGKIAGITLYGPDDQQRRTSIVSFSFDKMQPPQIVEQLEKHKIVLAVREIADKKIVRASPHFFNTESEILTTVEAIKNL
jgi:cysteine desulfurase/selenocysteine lyase